MKKGLFKIVLLVAVLVLIIVIACIGCRNKSGSNVFTLPSLPQPIAKEAVLITSAGQSTDTYIIRDIANQLMIHNFFMPQAKETDMEDINTVVFVVGYSPLGTKLNGISYENERERIEQLLERSKSNNITVITVFMGGKQRRGQRTDELLKLICPRTDYLIGMQDSNYDRLLTELAKDYNVPITLVSEVNDIQEPFASAFR